MEVEGLEGLRVEGNRVGMEVDGRAEGAPMTKVGFEVGATVDNTVGAAAELPM